MKTKQNRDLRRIMIVDDDHIVAQAICAMFAKVGYQCLVSHSGENAIECAINFAPDLLICDLHMPGMNGRTCAEQISRSVPACQVLFLTGDYLALAKAQDADRLQGMEQAFLVKPQPPLVLLREAKRLLTSVRKRPSVDFITEEESAAEAVTHLVLTNS